MWSALIVAAALAGLFAALWFTRCRVTLGADKIGEGLCLSAHLRLPGGWVILRHEIVLAPPESGGVLPKVTMYVNSKRSPPPKKKGGKRSHRVLRFLRLMLKEIVPVKAEVYLGLGVRSRADQTALLCGAATSLIYALYARATAKNADFEGIQRILPYFDEGGVRFRIRCMMRFTIGHSIRAAIKAVR